MREGHGAALLFDFNGVIVDDEEQHRATLESLLAEHGIPLTRDQYYADYLGWNDRMSFVIAFRQAGRPPLAPERLDDLVAEKTRRYGELIEQSVTFVPGAREFVERAADRFHLGIVSGARRHQIEHVLDTAGLRRHFEVIVAADDIATCKPDPAGYLAAHAALAQRRPLSRAACVAIEDSLPGLAAARAAGMRCIMLATNLAPEDLTRADAVWTSFVGHEPGELLPEGVR